MKFLVDESIDEEIIDGLRSDGHIVLSVSETKPSIADTEVMTIAQIKIECAVTHSG